MVNITYNKVASLGVLLLIWFGIGATDVHADADFLYVKKAGVPVWVIAGGPFKSIAAHPYISTQLMGVKDDGSVVTSVDLGRHWVQVANPGVVEMSQVVLGKGGTFGLDTRGKVWHYREINTSEGQIPRHVFVEVKSTANLFSLSMDEEGHLWGIVPGFATVMRSKDGGKTWSVVINERNFLHRFRQLAHGKDKAIFAVRVDGSTMRSLDQGKSWSSLNRSLLRIATGPEGALWGVDSKGAIWRNENPTSGTQWSQHATAGMPFGAKSVIPPGGEITTSTTLFALASVTPPPPPPDKISGTGCSAFQPCPGGYSCQPGVHKCYPLARLEGQPCSAGFGCRAGLNCEAGAQVCRAPGDVGDACHLTRPCGAGLSCQPGVQKCYPKEREEGQPCSAGFGCRAGLNCEAGAQICRKPGELGDACHATRPCSEGLSCHPGVHKCYTVPRQMLEPCSAGFECDEGLRCAVFTQRCVLGGDWTDTETCKAAWNSGVARTTQDKGVTTTYGTGSAQTFAMASLSEEVGVVYGPGGEFGCYHSACGGFISDLSISLYGAIGEYDAFDSVPGKSEVYGVSGGVFPFFEIGGAGVSVVRAPGDEKNPHGKVIGSVQSISFGVGILPAQATAVKCTTDVHQVLGEGGKPVSRR